MASFTKWYPAAEDNIVPFPARFSYPGQATPAVKTTPRINPKSGSNFDPGSVIRIEFPAQGYVNPRNTTLSFDVVLTAAASPTSVYARFQNNIQSVFSRARLLYGSTPLEDIIDYNVIVRNLTEWTGAPLFSDQNSITDGIGSQTILQGQGATSFSSIVGHTRQSQIQGISRATTNDASNNAIGVVPNVSGTNTTTNATGPLKRYSVQLAFGLFTQDKLIPVKFMASQLAIELTLANAVDCIFGTSDCAATYQLQNVVLVPEIMEFDAAYDAMFLKGMADGGVPIKFSSWHTYSFGLSGTASVNLQIQERSRSVKSIFTVQRAAPGAYTMDTHGGLYSQGPLESTDATALHTLQQYQYRIGGRYYPAAPVQCSTVSGGTSSNGASEAYVELGKALHTLGDFRLSTSLTPARWGYPVAGTNASAQSGATRALCDGSLLLKSLNTSLVSAAQAPSNNVAYTGGFHSQAFCMAVSLETTEGMEISGLNAEEQSDIILQAQWSTPQHTGYVVQSFVYYDAMLVIRENNIVELIQ